MTLGAEDRMAITELIGLHGHLVDNGELDRLDELFTADVVYDATDMGHGTMHGMAAVREAARAMGGHGPLGHHVTNVVLTGIDGDRVRVRSKGIGIRADGRCGSVTYDDLVVRGANGWRISRREVAGRRPPAGADERST
ncbi:nuclear transport factor 2 family protein [Streptomyces sp. NPDC052042]|uniref:nuclear transport factor 2 family protein n=1 Tax=Streptomyces sp. NPDC052042 TaxID=3365683 RepID=UPI0037D77682